jgi:hypothetical protein
MDLFLEEYFFRSYPRVYKEKISFRHANGWFYIIDRMSKSLDEHLTSDEELCHVFSITSVKEKFGSLIVYSSTSDVTINGILNRAAKESSITCEICGTSGSLNSSTAYMRTLCSEHKRERQ